MAIRIEKNEPSNLKKAVEKKVIITHEPTMEDIHKEQAALNVLRPAKKPMTIRLDEDCLKAWKATGRDWQTRMNAYLRKGVRL